MAKKTKKNVSARKPASKRPRKSDAWDRAFGERLRNARGEISQEEMAELLDVPVNTYQKWERGDRTFPKSLIKMVVIRTGHGPWLLLTGDPDYMCPAYKSWPQESGNPTNAKERPPPTTRGPSSPTPPR